MTDSQTKNNPPAHSGNLFILSAPSGAGKTTLCHAILHHFPRMRYSISYTTRSPRPGEKNGIDYHFISEETFETGLKNGQWAEWAKVHGHYYGTSGLFLEKEVAAGRDILLDIDVQGTKQVLERYPDSIAIFIMPPSMKVLEERLRSRGTDSPADIQKRLRNAEKEISQRGLYHHVIVNDILSQAINELTDLITTYQQKKKTHERP